MYRSTWKGQRLTLAASGWTWNDTFVLYDRETLSVWFGGPGPHGDSVLTCVAGPLQEATLSIVEHHRVIWRSWFALQPQTKVVKTR